MCGRYTFVDTKEIYERFGVNQRVESLEARYNVTPGSVMPVITRQSPPQIRLMKWGLVPAWAKDPRIGYKLINARAETVADKPAFKKALVTQRCLVPANGFYEWDKASDPKQPYYFSLTSKVLMAFAGLWDRWVDAEGKETLTYTVITTTANKIVESVHNRMPVILTRQGEDTWLDPDNQDTKELTGLLKPRPAADMKRVKVSKGVSQVKNDGPELINPVAG